MAVVVTAKSGYDIGYPWKGQVAGEDGKPAGERTSGGYYINAAQAGEAPGRWFGKGAEALGFTPGQVVERKPYDAVYQQVNPQDGTKLGNAPGAYTQYADHLARLMAAEPHATAERVAELERQAAQATRRSPTYTDVTVSLSKSISVLHASIRENERRAALAGDTAGVAYWQAREAEYQQIVQAANRAALEHLQRWAVTRTGRHGVRVDGQEPGRYEAADIIVTSWLQGTSREGDPQDHVHNVIARIARTPRDGKWRALDTMSVRAQLGAVQGIVSAHAEAALTRAFGVAWVARADGRGNEIAGITQGQMDLFSTRTVQVQQEGRKLAAAWERAHGRAPNRRELLFIMNEATLRSRQGKEDAEIDWRQQAEKWDATIGGDLAQIAPRVSDLGAPRDPREGAARDSGAQARGLAAARAGVDADAQARTMTAALARVQEKRSTWTRADLTREIAAVLPEQAHQLAPADAVELVHDLTARALAGETEAVACLEAPEWPPVPASLRRDLDGRSDYTRPGTERYATHVQLGREEQLTTTAQRTGAPCLTREESARVLGATAEQLEAAGRERAQDATAQLPSGLREDQAAALHHALTSPRTVSLVVGPAGSGKTHVLAQAARMWPGDVVGLAPSQAARNVLAGATGAQAYNTAQFLGHTKQERGTLGPMGIQPGTLILLDEASMTSLEDIADITEHVARNGGKLLITGDHGQLTAVEGGGGMALLARQIEHAQLATPVRFRAGWEREASLRLRAGDAEVLPEYDQHGRIRGGSADQVFDRARRGYIAATLDDRDALLMARSHDTCQQLAQQIRSDLQHLGRVDSAESEAALRDGVHASAGDLIITRENDHNLGVANGDTWRVEAVNPDGSVTMRKAADCDPKTGARRFAEDTVTYRDAARSADLAYVVTGHSAQGRTVEEASAIVTGAEDREWAYVALSRARAVNRAEVITEETRAADPKPGTRIAPEIAQADRAAAEREGQDVPATAAADSHAALGILSDVLDRPGAEMSALETMRRNLANADHLGKLGTIWEAETGDAIQARYERSLRDQLPPAWRDVPLSQRSTWLWRSLRQAEAAGLDVGELLGQVIAERSLEGSRDLAAVIDDRVRERTGGMVPQPAGPWAEQVPEIGDPDRAAYVRQLAAAMDARKDRLGEFTAEASPAWARRALGPVPEDALERLGWERRAADIAAYREQYGYDHATEAIGPEPTSDSPEKRAAWHAAFAAMGPVDGVDVRGEPDGRLLLMRRQYETETAWAPRWVGDELRQVRLGAEDASTLAIRSAAEAKAARERGAEDTADRHEVLARSARAMEASYRGYETTFAGAMEVRGEWEQATTHTRQMAIAADSEYRRRHPQEQLEPLRSAEPERAAEEEREQLVPAAEAGHTPGWVAELGERAEQTRQQLEQRAAERVPSEDPEWEDQGLAWPQRIRAERDAILQPPQPEIEPAARVAELAAEREAGL